MLLYLKRWELTIITVSQWSEAVESDQRLLEWSGSAPVSESDLVNKATFFLLDIFFYWTTLAQLKTSHKYLNTKMSIFRRKFSGVEWLWKVFWANSFLELIHSHKTPQPQQNSCLFHKTNKCVINSRQPDSGLKHIHALPGPRQVVGPTWQKDPINVCQLDFNHC